LPATGKPTAAETRDLEAIARDFESLVPSAPPAIKPDLKTAAHVYSALAAAFRTKNVAKIEAAGMALESSHAVEDLVEVETYADTHCAGG
jgi:predicted outer membrane protein